MQHGTDKWPSMFATITAAVFLGAFAAVYILDFSIVRMDWCGDASAVCLRDWIGALSGWVAAVGAGIAAYLTIRTMQSQIDEARRQTDFIVGDAPPDLLVRAGNRIDENVAIEITNWNRHPVEVLALDASIRDAESMQHELSYEDERGVTVIEPGRALPRILVPGWRNRSDPPHTFNALIHLRRLTPRPLTPDDRELVEVSAKVRIVGTPFRDVIIKGSSDDIRVY